MSAFSGMEFISDNETFYKHCYTGPKSFRQSVKHLYRSLSGGLWAVFSI